MKYRGLYNDRNKRLVNDIPIFHQIGQEMTDKDDITKEIFKLVGGDSIGFQVALCVIWSGRFNTPYLAYTHFMKLLDKVEDNRLNKSQRYNEYLFEYIFVCVEWIYLSRKQIYLGFVERFVKENRHMDKGEVWRLLNEKAGFDIDVRDFERYKEDRVFNDYWETFSKEE